jgi:hypothetical protein
MIGALAQVEECLPSIYQALSSNSNPQKEFFTNDELPELVLIFHINKMCLTIQHCGKCKTMRKKEMKS